MQQYRSRHNFSTTDFIWVSIQSLNITKTIGETATIIEEESSSTGLRAYPEESWAPSLSSLISATPSYGFTLGATRSILECIAEITKLQRTMANLETDISFRMDDTLEHILCRLNACRNQALVETTDEDCGVARSTLNHELAVQSQNKAFIYASYIYLYRTVLDVPPRNVKSYVSETFRHVDAFFSKSDGNFSIWPAFIAAVEAYTIEDMASARRWLNRSTSFGMGNRESVCKVVHEVWRIRSERSTSMAMNAGIVAVDWREVMRETDCDVLLV